VAADPGYFIPAAAGWLPREAVTGEFHASCSLSSEVVTDVNRTYVPGSSSCLSNRSSIAARDRTDLGRNPTAGLSSRSSRKSFSA
jgi:hypothetical protein